MKVDVEALYNLGIKEVKISNIESIRLSKEIFVNAINSNLVIDFNDNELSEFESVLILLIMGYFDRIPSKFEEEYITEKWSKIEDIYKSNNFRHLSQGIIESIWFDDGSQSKNISTIYDFYKKQFLDSYNFSFYQNIDDISKELLIKSFQEDLINLANDYNRTLNKIINESIGLSAEEIMTKINKMKDTPLINKNNKITHTLNSRVRNIARTTETTVKAQAILNTMLQLGAEEYDIVTAGDAGVCGTCRGIESNNPYNIGSGIVPAFHSHCRCIMKIRGEIEVSGPLTLTEFYDIRSKSFILI
jgi:hypothetical protein